MERLSLEGARPDERGLGLIEVLIALVVLSVGIFALMQVFPAASRSMQSSRMLTAADFYAQQKLEELSSLPWTDATLSVGRHPAASSEALGSSGQWKRVYQVSQLPAPLDNVKRIAVNVSWKHMGARSLSDTLYLRQ